MICIIGGESASTETEKWYGDAWWSISGEFPWYGRGGLQSDRAYAGIFSFASTSGYADVCASFRPVLVEQ